MKGDKYKTNRIKGKFRKITPTKRNMTRLTETGPYTSGINTPTKLK